MYREIKNAPVAARVPDIDTTAVPGRTPKMTPAVIVKGMAGTANNSRRAYTIIYAKYPRGPQSSTSAINVSKNILIWSFSKNPAIPRATRPPITDRDPITFGESPN
jgi:hypothetical protein